MINWKEIKALDKPLREVMNERKEIARIRRKASLNIN